jgi:hypothetical protein
MEYWPVRGNHDPPFLPSIEKNYHLVDLERIVLENVTWMLRNFPGNRRKVRRTGLAGDGPECSLFFGMKTEGQRMARFGRAV